MHILSDKNGKNFRALPRVQSCLYKLGIILIFWGPVFENSIISIFFLIKLCLKSFFFTTKKVPFLGLSRGAMNFVPRILGGACSLYQEF